MLNEFEQWDAIEQAARVRRGDVTPVELVDAAIERIERRNPRLNAVILPALERARREARDKTEKREPGGAFFGVPILMKDLGGQEAGVPCTMGMRVLKEAGIVEPVDSYFTARLRAAGFVSLGRTNSPELGLLPTTEPLAYGPTRNPHDEERSAGGSSGGSAAAVAAGMVAVAHASDGGGSIRIPASHCGLVGLKPTRGRNSFGPGGGERWGGFSCELVVAHSVRDVAAVLDVVAGPMPGDPYAAALPSRSFAALAAEPPRGLRIGMIASAPRQGIEVHPECAAAVSGAARLLESLGHRVEESNPEALSDLDAVRGYVGVIAACTARTLETVGERIGRELTAVDVEPLTWALAEYGRSRTATQHLATLELVHALGRRLADWWEGGFDLLLTPTTAQPAPRIGEITCGAADPLGDFLKSAPYGAYTSCFNMTGQPGISLPLHRTPQGLPIGVQLVAAYGREDMLLQVASQIEVARPWR